MPLYGSHPRRMSNTSRGGANSTTSAVIQQLHSATLTNPLSIELNGDLLVYTSPVLLFYRLHLKLPVSHRHAADIHLSSSRLPRLVSHGRTRLRRIRQRNQLPLITAELTALPRLAADLVNLADHRKLRRAPFVPPGHQPVAASAVAKCERRPEPLALMGRISEQRYQIVTPTISSAWVSRFFFSRGITPNSKSIN
jgi:hypothetical protein